MLYNYSVTPLKKDHFEERCEDIINQVKNNVATMPLFMMTLVPEGNPVWDKAGEMCKLYAQYRDELAKHSIPSGILVQASLGHGYEITPAPFQRQIGAADGKEYYQYCPEDKSFIEHFSDVIRALAKEHPSVIMLDDDFRIMMRPGKGCACPLHMKEFNRRTGLNMTREELTDYIFSHSEDDEFTEVFRDIQRDSLVNAARMFRDAIDSVDPSIQGINCTSGDVCESVMYTNKIFAGKDNPTMVRVPNGVYAPLTARGFSDGMREAAICSSRLKKHGIDIILAETDTVPFNRYAKSARHLHSCYTASLLEGLKGAKHWLSRSSAFEPKSGKAYRNILSEHYNFYEELSKLSDGIRWVGCNSAFIEQEKFYFQKQHIWRYHSDAWILQNIERMGLPFYFSETAEKASLLGGGIVADMTESQIHTVFEGSVFMDGESAKTLCERGYTDLIGVKVTECDLGMIHGETFDGSIEYSCTKQKNPHNIEVVCDNVEVLSYNYRRGREKAEIISPAVTLYRRSDGKLSVVYCGSPDAPFSYTEGFAFLNESRKNQFITLLKEADALPIYVDGDDEVCLRAGYLKDNTLLVALFELGSDPMESVTLYLKDKPTSVQLLCSDGKRRDVEWSDKGDNLYEICVRVETLYPVILLIN